MFEHRRQGKELTHRFWGILTAGEVAQSVALFHGSPYFDEITDVVFDFIGVLEFVVEEGIPEELAAFDAAASITNPKIRIAVVSQNPKIMAGVRDYCSSEISRYPVHICASTSEAGDWFMLPNSHFRKQI